MPPMPYHFEKGPKFSVLEDFLNGSRLRAAEKLEALRRGDPLDGLGYLTTPSAQTPPPSTTPLVQHVYKDWFGWIGLPGDSPPGTPPVLPPPPNAPKPTGYWTTYQGDVEQIVRLTFIRALEVSLGVPHDPPGTPVVPTRHWPIDITWKCAQAWFEGWVWWRQIAAGVPPEGVVILVLATPSTGTPLLRSIGSGLPGERNPGGDGTGPGGTGPTRRQGMWVISHEGNEQTFTRLTPSPTGEWGGTVNWPVTRGTGDVITWALAEVDGGVRPNGRAYP
jgi:hypothetical protein